MNRKEVYVAINELLGELTIGDGLKLLFMVMEVGGKGLIDQSDHTTLTRNLQEVEAGCAALMDRLKEYAGTIIDVAVDEIREETLH